MISFFTINLSNYRSNDLITNDLTICQSVDLKKGSDLMLEDKKIELTALREKLNEMGDSL